MLQANFPIGSRSITVYGLTQYDYGQVLEIYGLPLPAVVECQISLQNVGGTTESLAGVMVDNVLRLNIPDTYLAQDVTIDYAIYLFVYVTTEDSGTTVYKVILPVTSRPEPEGYVPGETSPFAAVIDEITDLVEDAQEAATASESWAVGGTGTRAGENTDNASYYATQAGESAVAAASSEGNAAASETAAASSERNAASSESNAASSERNAAVSETNAAASERNAADYAGAASISARDAGLSETAAEGHANSASSSASGASTNALKSEGYAVGKQNGTPVSSGSPYYHNNSKYYSEQAAAQIPLVTAEGSRQIGLVSEEGTAQKNAVQAKGQEVLESIPADYSELSADVNSLKSDKADADGTYSTLTAGNLATEDGSNNSTPYLFRASGGGVRVGEREYDKIVGGTVAWNQLINPLLSSKTIYNVVLSVTNNVYSLVGTANGNGGRGTKWHEGNITFTKDHVYYFVSPVGLIVTEAASGTYIANLAANKFKKWTDETVETYVGFNVSNGTTYNESGYVMLFDLTQMFGTTIADYLYTLQTATAGAGIAKLKEWGFFTEPYYPYNAGELKSVEGLTSHEMVGKNLFDISKMVDTSDITVSNGVITVTGNAKNSTKKLSDLASLVVGETYTLTANTTRSENYIYLYGTGANVTWTFGTQKTITQDLLDALVMFYGGANTTAQISDLMICFASVLDVKFESYVKHTYPLDSDLTLRGIPKLDANNQLYYDGDTYESDGTVTRRYKLILIDGGVSGMAFLGAWRATDYGYGVYINLGLGQRTGNAISDRFVATEVGLSYMPLYSFVGCSGAGATWTFILPSTVTSLNEANAWAQSNPFYILIPVETETTEEADPYAAPQIVDQYGTEEYVTTGIVPVGHETFYPENLRQKIEGLPWNFASLIAPTEVTYKATQNYTSGSLFIVDNVLYKATANIANGGTITPGTNCTPTTLAAVIAAL